MTLSAVRSDVIDGTYILSQDNLKLSSAEGLVGWMAGGEGSLVTTAWAWLPAAPAIETTDSTACL